jgi:hypothetical protein
MKVDQKIFHRARSDLMTSVAQLEILLKYVLEERANELAKETGFVKRERKLTGSDFVQIMAFGHLHQPQASLDQLTQVAQLRDVQISSSGLHQRCGEAAAAFLQAVLGELVQQVVMVQAAPLALFKPFRQGLFADSSTIVLPAALKDHWPGCGGGSAQNDERGEASLKVHVRWDLKSGQLDGPYLSAGRTSDIQASQLHPPALPGSLSMADRGYWSLERLRRMDQHQVRFCAYPKCNTVFWDQQGKRIDLVAALPRVVGPTRCATRLRIASEPA